MKKELAEKDTQSDTAAEKRNKERRGRFETYQGYRLIFCGEALSQESHSHYLLAIVARKLTQHTSNRL